MKNGLRMMRCAALLGAAACTPDGLTGPSPVEAPAALAVLGSAPAGAAPAPAPPGPVVLRCGGGIGQPGQPPVYIVDGVVVDSAAIHRLNPASIARIEVVRGAAAEAILGPRVAGGIIQITTKR